MNSQKQVSIMKIRKLRYYHEAIQEDEYGFILMMKVADL